MKYAIVAGLVSLTLVVSGCSTNEMQIQATNDGVQVEAEASQPTQSPEATQVETSQDAADSEELDLEVQFDAVRAAEVLFGKLDGTAGFSWFWPSEDSYEGAPILIALPDEAFSDVSQGCIVLGWDPAEYDYSKRIQELEGAANDMPGQAIWMGASEGLMVELRAFSPDAKCWQPTKEKLGWAAELQPTFVFPDKDDSGGQSSAVETVAVPNVVGVTEAEAKSWLTRNGYKFNVTSNYGLNPRLSLCVGGKGLVTGQSPRPGTEVKNQFATFFRLEVDCEWR
jgi:hypothetical protein